MMICPEEECGAHLDRAEDLGRRFPTIFRGAARGLIFLVALAGFGCSEGQGGSSESSSPEDSVRVLSKPVVAKAKPAMPDPSIWETALADPELEKGRVVWTGTCIQCHSIGLGGAPLIGNRELWGPRIEKGVETLISHAQNGFYGDVGEMPARGGNEELSDAQVEAAVRFMVSRAL